MLGGHLDDMEEDWSKPIVSMRYLVRITFPFIFQCRAVSKTCGLTELLCLSLASDAKPFSFLEESLERMSL